MGFAMTLSVEADGRSAPADLGCIGAVILNWNGFADTLDCAESILRTPGIHVCIVDNASTDGSVAAIEAWLGTTTGRPRVTLICNGRNAGFAGGMNCGLKHLLAMPHIGYMWLVNNDTVVDEMAAPQLLEATRKWPEVGIWGCRVEWFDKPGEIQVAGGCTYDRARARGIPNRDLAAPMIGCFDYIAGCAMFVPRAFLEDVGVMEEGYFLYFEEIDWAARARARWQLGWVPGAIIRHKEGASIGSNSCGRPSDLSLFYITRNRLLFTRKRLRSYLWRVRARLLFEVLVYARRRDAKAVRIILNALWQDAVHAENSGLWN